MQTLRAAALVGLLLVSCSLNHARTPEVDDEDEGGGGRDDQHVASVPLEHSFGV